MKKYTTINEFMHSLDESQREQVTLLHAIIAERHPELTEHIKWNSPSYVLSGIDLITFSVRPAYPVTIVLHMGATRPENKNGKPIMDDPSKLIEWKSDTRGIVSFANLDNIKAKKLQFATIVDQWLKIDI